MGRGGAVTLGRAPVSPQPPTSGWAQCQAADGGGQLPLLENHGDSRGASSSAHPPAHPPASTLNMEPFTSKSSARNSLRRV